LYRSPSDTILAKASPDYFTRTDSSGRFKIDYLSEGTYQLAAYIDDNSNYRYNQGIESVGFLDELVNVSLSLQDSSFSLVLSDELPPLKAVRGDQWFPGLVRITLNQPAIAEIEVADIPGNTLRRYQDADSLFVAYSPANDTLPFVVISKAGESDTVRLRKTARDRAPRLKLPPKPEVIPGETLVALRANLPLKSINETLIQVESDSVQLALGTWSISALDARKLNWEAPKDSFKLLNITFLPGALTTVFDSVNTDSLLVTYRPTSKKNFGELDLTIAGLDSLTSYVMELLDSNGDVERTIQLQVGPEGRPTPEVFLKLSRVRGGDYSVRFTEDLNKDGRYTPGNRRLDLQPERITTLALNTVRADWLVEERLELNF